VTCYGHIHSLTNDGIGWGASGATHHQQPPARSGWGSSTQGPESSQQTFSQQQIMHQPAQPNAPYQQQQGPQTPQPPASQPQSQPAQSTRSWPDYLQCRPDKLAGRALFVHPDRLNAVPQAGSTAASPPAQEFGFAGKGFGFGSSSNMQC
jgi:hypothetical protein